MLIRKGPYLKERLFKKPYRRFLGLVKRVLAIDTNKAVFTVYEKESQISIIA